MTAFPFSRRKVTRQGIEEIIVLILEYVFLAGHQRTRVLLLGMVAPIAPPVVSSGGNIAPVFCSSVPIRCVLPLESGQTDTHPHRPGYTVPSRRQTSSCPNAAAPFSWDSFIYWTPTASSVPPAVPGPVRPIFLAAGPECPVRHRQISRMSSASDMICAQFGMKVPPF